MFPSKVFLVLILAKVFVVRAALNRGFYDDSCPPFEVIVSGTVQSFLDRDPTVAPGLLRMLFHDAFVGGLDGSPMLNSSGGSDPPEKSAIPNLSLHGFDVIDAIKSKLEGICPGIVSCSDILATATRDAVVLSNGPFWRVKFGRRDGRSSNFTEANNLPSPVEDTNRLLAKFAAKGFNADEMVLLQGGGHSIGVGHCPGVNSRISNFNNTGRPDPTMDPTYASQLRSSCTANANAALPNDPATPVLLDNQYFANVRTLKGLFTSDQELFFDGRTKPSIDKYASSSAAFAREFAKAMQKLSELGVLTGSQGSIRKVCSIAN